MIDDIVKTVRDENAVNIIRRHSQCSTISNDTDIQGARRYSGSGIISAKYRGSSSDFHRKKKVDTQEDLSIQKFLDKVFLHDGKFFNFYFFYSFFLFVPCLIGGGIIANDSNISFLDGFYLAVSAQTCTGLGSVCMKSLGTGSFIIMAFHIFFGCTFWYSNIMPSLGKYYIMRKRKEDIKKKCINNEAAKHLESRYQAMEANLFIMISYKILWQSFAMLTLIGAFRIQPHPPEMELKKYTREAHAVFISISSFANAGYTMTSDSLISYNDNPLAYVIISFNIMAGLSFAPIFVRSYIKIVREIRLFLNYRVGAYDDLLKNGEDYSIFLFSDKKTIYLAIVNAMIILMQLLFWLFSMEERPEALNLYGSQHKLVGMGYFMAVSARYCGIQTIDLRYVTQGMLVVYIIAMYIPDQPFTTLDIFDENAVRIDKITSEKKYMDGHDLSSNFYVSQISLQTNSTVNQGKNKHDDFIKSSNPSNDQDKSKHVQSSICSTKVLNNLYTMAFATLKSHQVWLLLSILVLSFTEDKLCTESPDNFNIFYIFFEVISAYGNVGYSVGIIGQCYALSGAFSKMGKLVIIFVMYLGKHRGMPDPDSFIMDFSLKEFDYVNDLFNSRNNNKKNIEKSENKELLKNEIDPDGIQLKKKENSDVSFISSPTPTSLKTPRNSIFDGINLTLSNTHSAYQV